MKEKIEKFKKKFQTKGMVWQSSKFLIEKMIKNIDFSKDLVIVQFGSWKAVFQKQILKKMSKNSKLFVFEIDETCNKYSEKIIDERYFYINDSAENVSEYVEGEVDVIISTLPFWSLPKELLPKIIWKSEKILKKWWIFLQYQYFLQDMKSIEKIFWKKCKLSFEMINIPPAFIYRIEK